MKNSKNDIIHLHPRGCEIAAENIFEPMSFCCFSPDGAAILPHLLRCEQLAVVTTAALFAPCICGKLAA